MRAEESKAGVSITDRVHICFALGKALEDRSEFAESFKFYQLGNQLKQSQTRYDPARFEGLTSNNRSYYLLKSFSQPDKTMAARIKRQSLLLACREQDQR